MEREYYIIPDYAALKHLLQQKSVGTYQYRYKRFVMVLERNHQFLSSQISWIVDFNSVCFILIRSSSFITEIDHRSDHRCLLPPLSPTGVLSAFLARRQRRQRPAHGSTPVAAACARGTNLLRQWRRPPSTGQPRTALQSSPATRPACVPPSIRAHGSSRLRRPAYGPPSTIRARRIQTN